MRRNSGAAAYLVLALIGAACGQVGDQTGGTVIVRAGAPATTEPHSEPGLALPQANSTAAGDGSPSSTSLVPPTIDNTTTSIDESSSSTVIPDGSSTTTTAATATTGSTTTTTSTTGSTTTTTTASTDDEAEIRAAAATVLDLSIPFSEKDQLIDDPTGLEPVHDTFVELLSALGTIELAVSGVTVRGDEATVMVDVLIDGTAQLRDVAGEAVKSPTGDWQITRRTICSAVALAAVSCQ